MEAKTELEEMARMVSLEEKVVMVPTLLKSLEDMMAQIERMGKWREWWERRKWRKWWQYCHKTQLS